MDILPSPLTIKSIEYFLRSVPGAISFAQGALKAGLIDEKLLDRVSHYMKEEEVHYYGHPAGLPQLRDALAQKLPSRTPLTRENVLISHGSIGAFTSLLLALFPSRSGSILLPEPTYPVFKEVVTALGLTPKGCEGYKWHLEEGKVVWKSSIDRIMDACTSSVRMIALVHPGNPHGTFLTIQEMNELARFAQSKGIYLLVDEAYDKFVYDQNYTPFLKAVPFGNPYFIKLGTFSKSFAMSGWRVGYAIAYKEIIKVATTVQQATMCCPNVLGQYMALEALSNPTCMKDIYQTVAKSKKISEDFLEKLSVKGFCSFGVPQGGFYHFVCTPETDTQDAVRFLLKEAQVGVVPGLQFGAACGSFFRICFARHEKEMEEGMERLYNSLSTYYEKKHLSLN